MKKTFFVTRFTILISLFLLLIALSCSIMLFIYFKTDPYTLLFRSIKSKALDRLGIEVYCDSTPVNSIYKSFTLKDVHIKIKGQEKELFTSSSITFNQSLISTISTILKGTYPFSVSIEDADIYIDAKSKIDSQTEHETSSQSQISSSPPNIQDFFSNFKNGFEVSLKNVNVQFLRDDGDFYLNGFDGDLKLDSKFNFKKLNFNFKSVGFAPLNEAGISSSVHTQPYIDKDDNLSTRLSLPITLDTIQFYGFKIDTDNINIFFTSDEFSNVQNMGVLGDVVVFRNSDFLSSFSLNAFINLNSKNKDITATIDNIKIKHLKEEFKITAQSDNLVFKGDMISKEIKPNNKKGFISDFEFDARKGDLKFDISLNQYKLSDLNLNIPYIGSVGGDDGVVCDGIINLNATDIYHSFEGNVDFNTDIQNINLFDVTDGLKLNFKAEKKGNRISTSDFSLNYSKYKLNIDLIHNTDTKNIETNIDIKQDKNNILNLSFIKNNESINVRTVFQGGFFNAQLLNNYTRDIYLINSQLKYKGGAHSITGQYNKITSDLRLTTDGMNVLGRLKSEEGINAYFNNFNVYKDVSSNNTYTLTSLINFNYINGICLSSSDININLNNNSYISFGLFLVPYWINIQNIKFYADSFYSGYCNITINTDSKLIYEKININSEIKKDNKDYISLVYTSHDNRGTLSLNAYSFDTLKKIKSIPFENINLSLSLNTDFNNVFTGYAKGHLTTKINQEYFVDFEATLFDNLLNITNINASLFGAKVFDGVFNFNLENFDFEFSIDKLRYIFIRATENTNFDTGIYLKGNLKPFIDTSFSTFDLKEECVFDFGFKNMNLSSQYNQFYVSDDDFSIRLQDSIISSDGKIINGYFDIKNSYINLHFDKKFFAGFDVSGYFKNSIFDLNITNTHIPIDIITSLLWADSVLFSDGIFTGDVRFSGTPSSPQLFGTLKAYKTNIWCMWAENEDIVVLDPIINGYGSRIIIPKTKAYVVNKKSGRISNIEASFEVEIGSFNFPLMSMIIDVDKQNSVSLSIAIPVPDLQADIQNAWGHFEMKLYNQAWPQISFDCTVDGVVLAPPARYPSWFYNPAVGYSAEANYESNKYIKLDGKIYFASNSSIMYPNATTPLVKLDIKNNQYARIYFDDGKFWADGDVELRGGQIYYFQKGFLINEGDISWHKKNSLNEVLYSTTNWDKEIVDAFTGMSINVSSVLKDYDANGNPVDIYLTLQNASIDNLVPTFSSSTGLTENEIFTLLGQNILPANTYSDYGISSLAYMSSVALDVFNSLGSFKNIGVNSIDDTIKRVFGLDIFMIRQRVFLNLLTDIIPDYSGRDLNDSAFARYLNGTTLYLGKNITDNVYFQTSLRFLTLDKPNYKNKRLGNFFVQGLKTDVEFSFEWSNEVANFSLFTNPTELSFSSFINNIGIGIKKHIIF